MPSHVIVLLALIAAVQMYGIAKLKSMGKEQGKINTEIKNLSNLQKIEEVKANGKNRSEFEYYKRKDDSERVQQFSSKMGTLTIKLQSVLLRAADGHFYFLEGRFQPTEEVPRVVEYIEMKRVEVNEFITLMSDIEAQFNLYFKRLPMY